MPSSEVMKKFRKGKLHSGSKRGPRVTSKRQAKAIQISEARAEGHAIPPARKGRGRGGKSRGRRGRSYNRRSLGGR